LSVLLLLATVLSVLLLLATVLSVLLLLATVLSVLLLLATVLSVLLRYTDSDYTFGIFKLFLRLLYHVARRNVPILHTMSNISHLYRYLITDNDEISVSFLHFKTGSHGKINRILYKSYTIFVVYDTSFISNN
jgi:hypothetical protein